MIRQGLLFLTVLALCCLGSRAASPLSTHILDTTVGKPAANVSITVFKVASGLWTKVDNCVTNEDGRCGDLLAGQNFEAGNYKICFVTQPYFDRLNMETFFPYIEVVFRIVDTTQHYHVPLLLNPYSYSTYRGS